MSSSIQPRKQRKSRYDAPMHVRAKHMHVHIATELRAKLGVSRRSIQLHKGDKVRLRRGDEAGKMGAVMEVDCKHRVVYAEGFVNKTARGVEKLKALQPANLEIVDGDFAKKDRAAILARGKKKTFANVKTASAPAPKAAAPAKTQ
ncbi:50S ribosomal protein L24 [uncultured archaeon]|nr:50S ribosomal protein L24 [uncultured archaeon]